jgi:hypothetical protein
MDEQQVRLLVRQAIARHLGEHAGSAPSGSAPEGRVSPPPPSPSAHPGAGAATLRAAVHASTARFVILRPADETECIIEPSVACNHCGYCQCYGH